MFTLLTNNSLSKEEEPHESMLLYVEDVAALLAGRKSGWWIRRHFAPKAKLKIGRTIAWPRDSALAWIRSQGVSR